MLKTKTQKIIGVIIIMVLQGGVYVRPVYAEDPPIIISEIGAFESEGFEWIEIFVRFEEPIDITDWTFLENETNHKLSEFLGDLVLEPDEYAIIAEDAEKFLEAHPDFEGTLIDSSWGSLKESGEEIGLVDVDEVVIEIFTYIESPDTSLQRVDQNLFEYSESNWRAHLDSDTAGRENEFDTNTDTQVNLESQEDNEENDDSSNNDDIYEIGSIIINEVVSDPVSGEEEWVELFNTTAESISLEGWYMKDGSSTKQYLEDEIEASSYYLVSNPSFKLNNSGDIVKIFSPDEEIIDEVTYGEWDDGNIEDNYPAAEDPFSLARGEDDHFYVTEIPTPREANAIIVTQEVVEEETPEVDVVINELFINPQGSDRSEWIELINRGEDDVDISGYVLEDKEKVQFVFEEKVIKPQEYVVVSKNQSGITLNNDRAETIRLYSDTEKLMDKVSYKKGVAEGMSLARHEDDWSFSTVVTQGSENIIDEPNKPPVIKSGCEKKVDVGQLYVCDVSDSYDPDGDSLVFVWEIGEQIVVSDVLHYRFEKEGKEELSLQVSDGEDEVVNEFNVTVIDPEAQQESKKSKDQENTSSESAEYPFIAVDAILSKEKGEKIKTQGIVSVAQGVFGKTIAYIDGLALSLSSKSEWPELRIGDNILFEGSISKAEGPYKLNVKKDTINIIEENVSTSPREISIAEIHDKYVNYLIGIEGEIIDKERSCLSVADESNEEVEVCFKKSTGLKTSLYKEGDSITVIGVLTKTKDDVFQLLPRMESDIVSEPKEKVIDDEIVLGEKIEVSEQGKSQKTRWYLLIATATVLLAIAGVVVKSKLSK